MSIIVGIDTSSTDLGIGIYRDGMPLASYSRYIGNSHAEHLTPLLATLLQTNGIPPHTVRQIAIAEGPGSFTGLRIGIAFVKGFAAGVNARVLPVSSLEILAYAARTVPGSVISAIDARNGDIFSAGFRSDGYRLHRNTPDTVVTRKQFLSGLSDDDIIVTDTLGYARSCAFTSLPEGCRHLPVSVNPLQRGLICASTGVIASGNEQLWLHHTELQPKYLRRSTPELRREREGSPS